MRRRSWQQWEDNSMAYFADSCTCKQIAAMLYRTQYSVYDRLQTLGLRLTWNAWPDGDIAKVRVMAETETMSSIARHFGVSTEAMSYTCKRYDIKVKHRDTYCPTTGKHVVSRRWTKSDDAKLYELAGFLSPKEAARILGRSYRSTLMRCARLVKPWTRGRMTHSDVAEMLGVTIDTVMLHKKKLRQTWGYRSRWRDPTPEEIRDIARRIYESPHNIKGSILELKRIAFGDDETSAEAPNMVPPLKARSNWSLNQIANSMARAIAKELEAAE